MNCQQNLVEDKYFDYYSISKSIGKIWLFNKLSKRFKSPTDFAMDAIKSLFLAPANATRHHLEQLHHLFKTPKECFAYIQCNLDLSNEAKTIILLSSLEHFLAESNTFDEVLVDHFWRFAFDNKQLTDTYGRAFVQTYTRIMEQIKDTYSRGAAFDNLMASDISHLKVLILKLKYLPEPSIAFILNHASAQSFYKALLTSQSDPDLMLSFIQLMPLMETNALARALSHQASERKNILSILLSKTSKKNTEAVHKILHITATLSKTDQFSILQLDAANTENNPLIKAITHCPSAVPSLLQIMLHINHVRQSDITKAYLLNPVFRSNQNSCFKHLLEYDLAIQPEHKLAYAAAKQLQANLILALDAYFTNKENPNALPTLQQTWEEAIDASRAPLKALSDWNTFLKNLVLVVASIPLLGIPLAVNYCRSGYKSVFFQSEEPLILKQLKEVSEELPRLALT